jgi:hypothetical protein
MSDDLARLAVTSRELEIMITILRLFGHGDFFRSRKLTLDLIVDGFPDRLQEAARIEVLKMKDAYLLLTLPDHGRIYFVLNPNKRDLVRRILSRQLAISEPLEELIPLGYDKVPAFVSEGAKDSKGVVGKYFYYRRIDDPYHFCVFIQTSIAQRPEKKDMGSLGDNNSILGQVRIAIFKKLKKDRFYKAELDTLIPDHRIVQNRQPLKAAIDVLEFLGLVRKTGIRSGRSEEYQRTAKQPLENGLDRYLGGTEE